MRELIRDLIVPADRGDRVDAALVLLLVMALFVLPISIAYLLWGQPSTPVHTSPARTCRPLKLINNG